MNLFNFKDLRKKERQINHHSRKLFCLFLILLIFLNFLPVNVYINKINPVEEDSFFDEASLLDFNEDYPKFAAEPSMLQDPFTKNFDLLRKFFEDNYLSDLDPNVSTFFRYGDSNGIIVDDTVYSEDNLLYHKSLMQPEIDDTETFATYLELKSTPLWFEGNKTQFKYGFVNSVDNSSGQVKNENRYLIDNLMPIFLLIENIGNKINDISINNTKPKDLINEMFLLINSSEFWEEEKEGFVHHNSTSYKYTESNFYAILANLLIHRAYKQFDIPNSESIRDRAYELANKAMEILNKSMWNPSDKGFYHNANKFWDTSGPGQTYYHLSTNALGILTLLEFWIETGMKNDSRYYQNAIDLYNSLENLWGVTDHLYQNISYPNWGGIFDSDYDLKANALMMSSCLKLFEATGNITYYDRVLNMSKYFEANFYDNSNNAYNFSLADGSKVFNSNLKLTEAYIDAFEIYNSTILNTVYNVSDEVPNFIFEQEIMNLTSTFSFKKVNQYYNPGNDSYVSFTIKYDITNADITYLFKYPNGTFLSQFNYQILSPATSHTLLYNIEDTLPIGDEYYIYVWANTTYFSMTEALKRFNVTSGLINSPIEGLVSRLYQGPIVNITLPVNNTRNENLTCTASLEGDEIINYPSQDVNFTMDEVTHISFNLTAKFGAVPGSSEIFLKIKRGNVLYLKVKEVIKIGYSFNYTNFMYQSKVVSGEDIHLSLDLINFLPNATQSFNVSFTGVTEGSIESLIKEETLQENEIKTVSYDLLSFEEIKSDTIQIKMDILINTTMYYTETFTVEIIPKFEIISVTFPDKVSQGSPAYLIIIIQHNLNKPEEFSLYINGNKVGANINELVPGENRIVKKITPTNNPYEFGTKKYRIELRDSSDEEIVKFYFEIVLELSIFNLIIYYILPILIPIGIMLYFLNKDIKHKKLRR